MGGRRHRALAAVLLVWLVVYVGEPVSLRACPLHDGAARAEAPAAGGAAYPRHGGAHAGHALWTGHGLDHHARHGCTCLGACCASTACAAPEVGVALTAADGVARSRPRPAPAPIDRSAPREHALPPSVGPPPIHLG